MNAAFAQAMVALSIGALLIVHGPLVAQQNTTTVKTRNAAFSLPMGQGLHFVHGAEPLGKGQFRLRALNQSRNITLPKIGGGTSYTGQYGIGYGLLDGIDLTLLVPFLLDSAGGLNKYGSGDPVLGLKFSRPSVVQSSVHSAIMIHVGLPFGYKGQHALDQMGEVRKYSNEALDTGLQIMFDMHFDRMSLFLNGGFFRSGNPEVLPLFAYGIGTELGRDNRWASFNMEYQARLAIADQSRAAGILKFGTRVNLFKGFQFELNREFGFHDYPKSATTFGVRTHGYFRGQRRFESRRVVYAPAAKVERIYEPDRILRLAIFDFEGFEEVGAGRRIVDRITSVLSPYDSLEVIDVRNYRGLPDSGILTADKAMEIGRALDADVVVSGQVIDYRVERFAGLKVPFIFEVPKTVVDVGLRYKIMWFTSPAKTELESLVGVIAGRGLVSKRMRLMTPYAQDITIERTAVDMEEVQTAALFDLTDNLLSSMSAKFDWIPPDFNYEQN
tara:strand:+ start:1016 stop:2515 length:1500 start_codon:yes stop_codon:yes gene_type:complete